MSITYQGIVVVCCLLCTSFKPILLGSYRERSITVKHVIENSRMNPNWPNMYRSIVYVA